MDASGSITEEVADAINRLLGRMDVEDRLLLCGQTTNSGGGGVLYNLARSLEDRQRTKPYLYFIGACSIQAWNKPL